MKAVKCGGGHIYVLLKKDIEYVGCFYGNNGNEDIKSAYARMIKLRGRPPDFFMNGELFDFKTRAAASDIVYEGKAHRLTQSYGISFVNNRIPVFSYNNNAKAPDYIGAYPLLVKEGKKQTSEPKGIGGVRGRIALGVNLNDFYMALIPDSKGVSLSTLRNHLISAGATEAINLDGGGSAQFYAPMGNHFTGRKVRGFVGVWTKKGTEKEDIRVVTNVKKNSFLNIRSGPSTLHRRVGKLYYGDSVNVLEEKNGWARISVGWVSAKYLTRKG